MRKLLATIVLSLTLGAGASLPAAAQSGQGEWRDWSEGPRFFHAPPAQPPQGVGRATYSDRYSWDDEEVRPRRRAYNAGRAHERRYTKRQHQRHHRRGNYSFHGERPFSFVDHFHLTTTLPIIPASRWPGIRHENSKVPFLLKCHRISALL